MAQGLVPMDPRSLRAGLDELPGDTERVRPACESQYGLVVMINDSDSQADTDIQPHPVSIWRANCL